LRATVLLELAKPKKELSRKIYILLEAIMLENKQWDTNDRKVGIELESSPSLLGRKKLRRIIAASG
jgi:hypothetical protein